MNAIRFRITGLFLALALTISLLAPASHAGSLSSDVIGLFPASVGEFAYADLRQARAFPWFAQLKEQMLPAKFRQFEQFLASAGMDPNTQVEEMAWALVATSTGTTAGVSSVPTGEQIIGVAMGQFQPAAMDTYFKSKKTPSTTVRGYTMYAFGATAGADDLVFLFLDANTAAFGQRTQIEKMLEVRFGAQPSVMTNTTIYPLINQANGHGIVWSVLNPSYARLALGQLVPDAAQLAQAAPLLSKIQSLLITIQSGNGIQADFQANCATPEDANTLNGLLQAGLMLEKYQATAQKNDSLSQMLETAKIVPSGNRLNVDLSLSNAQITSLIASKTFALQN
jgi:hypothetical protein